MLLQKVGRGGFKHALIPLSIKLFFGFKYAFCVSIGRVVSGNSWIDFGVELSDPRITRTGATGDPGRLTTQADRPYHDVFEKQAIYLSISEAKE